jgi:hypothetical protein
MEGRGPDLFENIVPGLRNTMRSSVISRFEPRERGPAAVSFRWG